MAPGEAFKVGRVDVDAQRHAVGRRPLGDELVEAVAQVEHGQAAEFALPARLERLPVPRLQLGREGAAGRRAGAARAHARVEPDPALVQVAVPQRLVHPSALVLQPVAFGSFFGTNDSTDFI